MGVGKDVLSELVTWERYRGIREKQGLHLAPLGRIKVFQEEEAAMIKATLPRV